MGAGALTPRFQTAQTSAKDTLDKMNVPKDTPDEVTAKIQTDLMNNAMFVDMLGTEVAAFKGANPEQGAPVPPGVKVLYEGVDDDAKKLAIGAAVSKWHCHNIMMGACLLAKHHDKINAYFEACGPGPTSHGVQVTRKCMRAKLKDAGKVPDENIERSLDWFMSNVGKEHDRSNVTAEVKNEAIKKLVVDESSADNWDDENQAIRDKSLCPKAAGIKANLDMFWDSESEKEELGVSRHENRMFWLNDFTCNGEEPTLRKLASCMFWVTGEGKTDFTVPDAKVKE